MLLKIQKDEALDSFLSRNKQFFQERFKIPDPARVLGRGSRDKWLVSVIKEIASAISGCDERGFDKLLHRHTRYFEYRVVTDRLNHPRCTEYSDDTDLSWTIRGHGIGFCLECVRNDLDTLGFSYWRRSHQAWVDVCSVHNVTLKRECHVCRMPFSLSNYYSDILWQGCQCGASLLDGDVIKNLDEFELKKSKFYSDMFDLGYYIDSRVAHEVIVRRLRKAESERGNVTVFRSQRSIFYYREGPRWHINYEKILSGGHQGLSDSPIGFINLALMLFSSMEELILHMDEVSSARLPAF